MTWKQKQRQKFFLTINGPAIPDRSHRPWRIDIKILPKPRLINQKIVWAIFVMELVHSCLDNGGPTVLLAYLFSDVLYRQSMVKMM